MGAKSHMIVEKFSFFDATILSDPRPPTPCSVGRNKIVMEILLLHIIVFVNGRVS